MSDPIRRLREENEALRERIRQLEEALIHPVLPPLEWRLSPKQSLILQAIRAASPSYLHLDRAMVLLYGMSDEVPDKRVLYVFMAHTRRKLERAGVPLVIEAVPFRGWRLTPESRATYDAAIKAENARLGLPRDRRMRAKAKQSNTDREAAGRLLDGVEHNGFPEPAR